MGEQKEGTVDFGKFLPAFFSRSVWLGTPIYLRWVWSGWSPAKTFKTCKATVFFIYPPGKGIYYILLNVANLFTSSKFDGELAESRSSVFENVKECLKERKERDLFVAREREMKKQKKPINWFPTPSKGKPNAVSVGWKELLFLGCTRKARKPHQYSWVKFALHLLLLSSFHFILGVQYHKKTRNVFYFLLWT